ncbi:MAG: hypothetical protein COT45_05695 [bacterium (Candidatus Stahlbacteria) CG08_land_8_20_14_0_20_40_26]|nr:MAG: hypothetical protein COX49_05600 [bacterium (Candidatus Stahlbacteria) CG23_combo_of_CG06-09_8_20_14_all_40_9]PIS23616.1 MAG: hypothetical protein COT45_05695 [bacterium (Candidatus Stahlbacteria) CG08_land_8_20_14_0_20_40_26]
MANLRSSASNYFFLLTFLGAYGIITNMVITFIGTGCGVPSKVRGSPSILLSLDHENILFDTGPGSLRELLKAGYTYNDIDHIFYTHFHVDHISDLAPFIFASKYPLAPRRRDVNIVAPRGIKKFWDRLSVLYGEQLIPSLYSINILTPEEFIPNGWKLKTAQLPHTEESIGYRVEKGEKVFVYSGDTGYSEELIELGKNADALVLECSFPQEVQGHLYPQLAGRVARECNAKLLLLTHIYPVMKEEEIITEIGKEFGGQFIVARDGMRVEIG